MKKKILFLITTLNSGGAEKALVDIVNALPDNEYDITIQTIVDGGPLLKKLNRNIKYKQIFHSKSRIVAKLLNRIIKFFPKFIYKKYIKDGYDIEVAFLEGKPTRLLSYSTEEKSQTISWIHTDLEKYYDSGKDYLSFDDNKETYLKFDKIVCVSEDVKKAYLEKFNHTANNVYVLYNLIDSETIQKQASELFDYEKDVVVPIVMACGRLCEQKGFRRLIDVHSRLVQEGIAHKLWIVGDGPERKQLEGQIRNDRLEDSVKLWGFQDNPYKYMRRSDLFVCASIAEGYSTVVTEAVVLGIPILSVDVAGAKEPLNCPRCNMVVDNSEEALYEGLKFVLTNTEILKQYRNEQFEKFEHFEKEKLVRNIVEFFEV